MTQRFRSVFLAALCLFAASAAAQPACDVVASITSYEGQVSIKPARGVLKRSPGQAPSPLCAGDEVHTFAGRALIANGRFSVAVDRDSVALFKGAGLAGLAKGQALYEVQKRRAGQSVHVATRLSVIGVKGTRFLVRDQAEGVSVVLDQGVVDVRSTQGPLGLYREKAAARAQENDFEAYKRQAQEGVEREKAAFEAYKAQTEREFVAYVENMTLQAGRELAISGHIAVERAIAGESARQLEDLRVWLDLH
ncbi:MAG: FecR domain-containing protein [Betaproteobacteria bacterium]|nr:FecR domain-containing protein [Betaproteobacteria bacterium]